MSKFKNRVKGNGNQIVNGDGKNIQDNRKVVNNHYYRHGDRADNDFGAILIGAAVAILISLGAFYKYAEEIFPILNLMTFIPIMFSLVALLCLLYTECAEIDDYIASSMCILFSACTLFLLFFARNQIPESVLNFSNSTQGLEFFLGLTKYGKLIVFSTFFAAIFLVLAVIANIMVGFNHLSYAFSNSSAAGIWYRIYEATKIFSIKTSTVVMMTILLSSSYVASSRIFTAFI